MPIPKRVWYTEFNDALTGKRFDRKYWQNEEDARWVFEKLKGQSRFLDDGPTLIVGYEERE